MTFPLSSIPFGCVYIYIYICSYVYIYVYIYIYLCVYLIRWLPKQLRLSSPAERSERYIDPSIAIRRRPRARPPLPQPSIDKRHRSIRRGSRAPPRPSRPDRRSVCTSPERAHWSLAPARGGRARKRREGGRVSPKLAGLKGLRCSRPLAAPRSYVPILRRDEDPLEKKKKVSGNAGWLNSIAACAPSPLPRARSCAREGVRREEPRSGRAPPPSLRSSRSAGGRKLRRPFARAREQTAGGIARNRSGVFSPRVEFGPRALFTHERFARLSPMRIDLFLSRSLRLFPSPSPSAPSVDLAREGCSSKVRKFVFTFRETQNELDARRYVCVYVS